MVEDKDLLKRIASREEVITVLGLGHVGLPTALGLAELGWKVVGVDSDPAKTETLEQGRISFYEPGLEELFVKHSRTGNFQVSRDVDAAIGAGRILFVCVGTPQGERGEPDLSQVETVARVVARNLNGYKLIVEKSTVPAITGQWIKKTVQRYAKLPPASDTPYPFEVASNPEFLQEGSAVRNILQPDRVVCGVESEFSRKILEEIYRSLECPVIFTDLNTAELIKHAANAFLATKISFINMVGDLCEAVGGDVTEVAKGIGLDPRIGPRFLNAGIGFGGYCLPKDLRAFLYLAEEHGADFSLLREVERINAGRIDRFLSKLRRALWIVQGKTLGVFGLAFKPGTDDIREAPSVKIIKSVLAEGAALRLHDPQATLNMKGEVPPQEGNITYCSSPYEAAEGAHAILLLTEWEEYAALDWGRLRDVMEIPLIVDGRNLLDPKVMQKAGFEYVSMGR